MLFLASLFVSVSTEVFQVPSMSSLLGRLGLAPNQVFEIILTTVTADGLPNAAPMGVWVRKDWSLSLRPFRDTLTARNLRELPEAVVNITNDPYLFFCTAFKEEVAVRPQLLFEPAKSVKAPRLHGMLGYIEMTIKPHEIRQATQTLDSGPDVAEFDCSVRKVDAPSQAPAVYSRARFAAIEAVIHATRIRALHAADPAKSKELLAQIRECRAVVQRVAPESRHAQVVENTLRLVQRWTKA